MKKTSQFIAIEINPKLFSNIFSTVYWYLKDNNILEYFIFQNILSLHITLYYLPENITNNQEKLLFKDIENTKISSEIFSENIWYFRNNQNNYSHLYFAVKTQNNLPKIFSDFHNKYNFSKIHENNLEYTAHINFLKILDSKIFLEHQKNIEKIIFSELNEIKNKNISHGNVSLYAVNSHFWNEIQIKI